MINYNNKMKQILGDDLELMIRDRAFDKCSWIEEDEDQIYCIIEHSFDLNKNGKYQDLISSPNSKWESVEISETYDRQSELYETQLLFCK